MIQNVFRPIKKKWLFSEAHLTISRSISACGDTLVKKHPCRQQISPTCIFFVIVVSEYKRNEWRQNHYKGALEISMDLKFF